MNSAKCCHGSATMHMHKRALQCHGLTSTISSSPDHPLSAHGELLLLHFTNSTCKVLPSPLIPHKLHCFPLCLEHLPRRHLSHTGLSHCWAFRPRGSASESSLGVWSLLQVQGPFGSSLCTAPSWSASPFHLFNYLQN